jgi:pimeloyl-ACP methyl ester carboxylesterase
MALHPAPFVHEAGTGPAVVCLHSNAASSSQWLDLSATLSPRYRVLAPDFWGSGRSPRPQPGMLPMLGDELDLLEPVFRAAGERFFLVGHSYGGAAALVAAARWPQRVAGLVLYEPTLFALLEQQVPNHPSNAGILGAVGDANALLDAGRIDFLARRFIDYWMGEGAWDAVPANRKGRIAESMANLPAWSRALTQEPTRIEALAALRMPILLMRGARSPQSAQGVADELAARLHEPELVTFGHMGHMGPLTHAAEVNAAIAAFLGRIA